MTYNDLVEDLAIQASQSRRAIREVLEALPVCLMQMEDGDDVRTPLGVFRKVHSPARDITLPDGETKSRVPEKRVVRLKPGKGLTEVVS